MVIAVWVMVALFWATVIAKKIWNMDEKRQARLKDLEDRLLLRVFDAIEWMRVKVFRRKPTLTQTERNAVAVKMFLDNHGIRHVVKPLPDGGFDYLVHKEDAQRLNDLLAELEQQGQGVSLAKR